MVRVVVYNDKNRGANNSCIYVTNSKLSKQCLGRFSETRSINAVKPQK